MSGIGMFAALPADMVGISLTLTLLQPQSLPAAQSTWPTLPGKIPIQTWLLPFCSVTCPP